MLKVVRIIQVIRILTEKVLLLGFYEIFWINMKLKKTRMKINVKRITLIFHIVINKYKIIDYLFSFVSFLFDIKKMFINKNT